MIATDYIFGRKESEQGTTEINTIIGGVSSSIPNKDILASKLGIPLSAITNFVINGVNVEAFIDSPYDVPDRVFENDVDITKYEDLGGMVTSIGIYAFTSCSNFARLYSASSNINHIGNYIVRYTPDSLVVELPNITDMTWDKPFAYISASLIDVRSALYLGSSVGNDNFFFQINGSCEIIAHNSLATSNNGSEEGDIAYARGRGCLITYI